jgi:hypothetical protein
MVPIEPARHLSFLEEEERRGEGEQGKGLKKRMFSEGICHP